MRGVTTLPWKTEDHLETPEDIAAYLDAVFEDGDPALIAHALGAVARSKGMTEIARETGRGRQSLYKSRCRRRGTPEFATVLDVAWALGVEVDCGCGLRDFGGGSELVDDGPGRLCHAGCSGFESARSFREMLMDL